MINKLDRLRSKFGNAWGHLSTGFWDDLNELIETAKQEATEKEKARTKPLFEAAAEAYYDIEKGDLRSKLDWELFVYENPNACPACGAEEPKRDGHRDSCKEKGVKP